MSAYRRSPFAGPQAGERLVRRATAMADAEADHGNDAEAIKHRCVSVGAPYYELARRVVNDDNLKSLARLIDPHHKVASIERIHWLCSSLTYVARRATSPVVTYLWPGDTPWYRMDRLERGRIPIDRRSLYCDRRDNGFDINLYAPWYAGFVVLDSASNNTLSHGPVHLLEARVDVTARSQDVAIVDNPQVAGLATEGVPIGYLHQLAESGSAYSVSAEALLRDHEDWAVRMPQYLRPAIMDSRRHVAAQEKAARRLLGKKTLALQLKTDTEVGYN